MNRFNIARANVKGIELSSEEDVKKYDAVKDGAISKSIMALPYDPSDTDWLDGVLTTKAPDFKVISDGLNQYEILSKDLENLENKAELCALIAQKEYPDDYIKYAVELMDLSNNDLLEKYNKIRGTYRGLKVKND